MQTLIAIRNVGLLSFSLLQSDISSDFNDLGHMLLGGFALALVLAVLLAYVKLKTRDTNAARPLLSINPQADKDDIVPKTN